MGFALLIKSRFAFAVYALHCRQRPLHFVAFNSVSAFFCICLSKRFIHLWGCFCCCVLCSGACHLELAAWGSRGTLLYLLVSLLALAVRAAVPGGLIDAHLAGLLVGFRAP